MATTIRTLFFTSRRRHTRLQGAWSSDVCSSDLDELFGEERLRLELADSGRPEAAVARVERALAAFAGGIVADDAALVAIMREGSAAEGADEGRPAEPATA